jgi:hypothetical protein
MDRAILLKWGLRPTDTLLFVGWTSLEGSWLPAIAASRNNDADFSKLVRAIARPKFKISGSLRGVRFLLGSFKIALMDKHTCK